MADLKPVHKRWIVQQLAIFESPKAVAEAFTKEFPGVHITRKQAWEYDCTRPVNRRGRSSDLVELFDTTRAEYQERVKDIPIANKAWRMEQLNKLYDAHVSAAQPRYRSAAAVLEQAAKEDGGQFTNKHDITSGGAPFKALVGISIEDV